MLEPEGGCRAPGVIARGRATTCAHGQLAVFPFGEARVRATVSACDEFAFFRDPLDSFQEL